MSYTTTGTNNTALGYNAMRAHTTGGDNVAVGFECLDKCTTADNTVAMGSYAASELVDGHNNTCVGYAAGFSLSTGGNNLLVGRNAGRATSPSGNLTSHNNIVVLGDNSISDLYCADTSISSSDSRDKTDITDFTKGLDWIKALRPVTYRWDKRTWYGTDEQPYGTPDGSKKRSKLHIGFLAQEALEIEKTHGYGSSKEDMLVVNLTPDEMSYGMKYERLVPVLVNAIKELSAEVEQLKSQLNN